MRSYNLSHNYIKPDTILKTNTKEKYTSKSLKQLKQDLNDAKNQLDDYFKNKIFIKFWKLFDPFRNDKEIVAKIACSYNVTNAWLKCYEILEYYQLIPKKPLFKKFIHFDNAAFPGSFITCTHHYINTKRSWYNDYDWFGNSLIQSTELNNNPLDDKYKLYQNYPDHWLMDENNNGDVLVMQNQKSFSKMFGKNGVDLYTSDLGFDVSDDYNNQELMHAKANIGQIVAGLITLRKGGSFITKQYTSFEMITISVMYVLSLLFDEFYLCKPFTSREANSETYLIGKGFKKKIKISHPYIQALLDRINGKVKLKIPIFNIKDYYKRFLKKVINANKELFSQQLLKIKLDIKRSLKARDINDNSKSIKTNPIAALFTKENLSLVLKWYDDMAIQPINQNQMLNMEDAYHQLN